MFYVKYEIHGLKSQLLNKISTKHRMDTAEMHFFLLKIYIYIELKLERDECLNHLGLTSDSEPDINACIPLSERWGLSSSSRRMLEDLTLL